MTTGHCINPPTTAMGRHLTDSPLRNSRSGGFDIAKVAGVRQRQVPWPFAAGDE